jgi:undecaprenyl-diphosphatase
LGSTWSVEVIWITAALVRLDTDQGYTKAHRRRARYDFAVPGDTTLLLFVNGLRTPWLDPAMRFATEWGLYAFPIVLVLALAARRSREEARTLRDGWLAFLLSLLVSETVLKPILGRPRPTSVAWLREQLSVLGTVPPAGSLGLPSGTATACMAGATWIALRHVPRWGALAAALAIALSFTRLYAGVHYPSDLLAGWLVGVATAVGVDRFSRWAGS